MPHYFRVGMKVQHPHVVPLTLQEGHGCFITAAGMQVSASNLSFMTAPDGVVRVAHHSLTSVEVRALLSTFAGIDGDEAIDVLCSVCRSRLITG